MGDSGYSYNSRNSLSVVEMFLATSEMFRGSSEMFHGAMAHFKNFLDIFNMIFKAHC
jgi:hypothetical protein